MSKIVNPLTNRYIKKNSKIYNLLTNDTIFKDEDNVLVPVIKTLYHYNEKKKIWLHNKFMKKTTIKKVKPEKVETISTKNLDVVKVSKPKPEIIDKIVTNIYTQDIKPPKKNIDPKFIKDNKDFISYLRRRKKLNDVLKAIYKNEDQIKKLTGNDLNTILKKIKQLRKEFDSFIKRNTNMLFDLYTPHINAIFDYIVKMISHFKYDNPKPIFQEILKKFIKEYDDVFKPIRKNKKFIENEITEEDIKNADKLKIEPYDYVNLLLI